MVPWLVNSPCVALGQETACRTKELLVSFDGASLYRPWGIESSWRQQAVGETAIMPRPPLPFPQASQQGWRGGVSKTDRLADNR